jgi:hypothetical protein
VGWFAELGPFGITRRMKRFACMLVCVGLLNFCAFMAHDSLIGGSAGLGKVENGKYYVGSHGHYTEVSQAAFEFSKWHEVSALLMFLVAMLILMDMIFSKSKWGNFKWSDCTSRKKSGSHK